MPARIGILIAPLPRLIQYMLRQWSSVHIRL